MNTAQPHRTNSRHDRTDDFGAAGVVLAAADGAMIGVSEFAARGVNDASSSALMH
jgi:hypothetical protein